MKHQSFGTWVLRLFLACFVPFALAVPTFAEEIHTWSGMRENSFPPTIEAAHEQCLRARLTPLECDEFADKLTAGDYETSSVPEGTTYSGMNYAVDGEAWFQGKTLKAFGGNTPVRRVTLSTGRTLDWYTDMPGACNNVGLDPRLPTPGGKLICELVPMQSNVISGGIHMHLDGTFHQNCCCPVQSHRTPSFNFTMGSTQQAGGVYRRCTWVTN